MEGFKGAPAGRQCGCEGRSPVRMAGDYLVEEKEGRRWRHDESLRMKSSGYNLLCIKQITTLLGEKKDSCVNLRVLFQQKVEYSFWEVQCLRERG